MSTHHRVRFSIPLALRLSVCPSAVSTTGEGKLLPLIWRNLTGGRAEKKGGRKEGGKEGRKGELNLIPAII